jgi:voltage-gated potassium channel Kch
MSKNEEDASKNNEISSSKKKKINLNIIEINNNENSKDNSKEENSYSISGQNMNKNYDVTNNSDFLNDSLNSDDMKIENPNNTFHKEKGLNLSKISNSKKKKYRNSLIDNNFKFNINRCETNTLGNLLQKSNKKIIKPNNKIKKRRKTIKKMQTIESFSNFEEEDNQLTIRQRLTQFFELNDRLFYIKTIVSILTTLSYIYYLVCTYVPKLFKSLNYIDFVVCSLVIIEHIINLLLAHHILTYLISIESLIDFVIEIPPFFAFMCEDYHLNVFYRFINITRVIRLIKSYILIDILQSKEKSVKNQILNIIFSILLVILIFSGVIQMMDFENVDEQMKIEFGPGRHNLLLRRYFHHYFYFIIVSLTTVGYGEIIPLSILSQMMIIALVVVIIVIIPDQTNELINLSNAQTIYEVKEYISSQDVPFVVLIGNIGLDALKSFCEEYFHSDHGKYYRHIVILMNKFPSKQFESFLNKKVNNKLSIIYKEIQ